MLSVRSWYLSRWRSILVIMNVQNKEVDDYIAKFSGETRQRLEHIRDLVRVTSPDAAEAISYGLIGYKRNGKPLIYFGGFEKHIGFYATPNGHEAFAKEFSKYKQGKGSVQFPLEKSFPTELIKRVIEYRNQQTEK
jgi:uncharacterized protein YdhG (YjbR/CyaY superfamily)